MAGERNVSGAYICDLIFFIFLGIIFIVGAIVPSNVMAMRITFSILFALCMLGILALIKSMRVYLPAYLRRKAQNTEGVFNRPTVILFTSPKKVKMTEPDFVIALKKWFKKNDPKMLYGNKAEARELSIALFSAMMGILVEVNVHLTGFSRFSTKNMACKIQISSGSEELTKTAVQVIVNSMDGNATSHVLWEKIESKYGVRADQAIDAWVKASM